MNIPVDGFELRYLTNGKPIYLSVSYYDEVRNYYINVIETYLPIG
jgi:hypothetical protein